MSQPDSVSLRDVATRLYARAPKDFVAARAEQARTARSAGDKEAASTIAGWRRPTVSAWLVNVLVRAHPDDLDALLELGGRLRAAQASLAGADLRALTKERQNQVGSLLRLAKQQAQEHDATFSDATSREVESTLLAALADESVGEAVRSGHLTMALSPAGFGPMDLTEAVALPVSRAAPTTGRPTGSTPTRVTADPGRSDASAAAQAELEAAATTADEADRAVVEATEVAQELAGALTEARSRLAELETELRRARSAVDSAQAAGREAQAEVQRRERAAQQSRRQLDLARRKVARTAQ